MNGLKRYITTSYGRMWRKTVSRKDPSIITSKLCSLQESSFGSDNKNYFSSLSKPTIGIFPTLKVVKIPGLSLNVFLFIYFDSISIEKLSSDN